jgi:type II secretory pathway component GspD/PulD (secretin)
MGMTKRIHAIAIAAFLPLLQVPGDFAARSVLKPGITGIVSIPEKRDARTSYELLAERGGINVVFHPSFTGDAPVERRIESVDFFDALDNLSAQTRNLWFPFDARTIVVGSDALTTQRDIGPRVFKTVYLGNLQAARTAEIANTLRTRLQLRTVFSSTFANAIVLLDTPERMAQAERMIAELAGSIIPLPTSVPVMKFGELDQALVAVLENGTMRNFAGPMRTHVEDRLKGAVSIDRMAPLRDIFESLSQMANLNIIFDRRLPEAPSSRFRVENVNLLDALDLLALQTRTIWQPLNESTLWVAQDTATNRRDYGRMMVKVVYLSSTATQTELAEVTNLARIALGARTIFQVGKNNGIVIKDTPNRVFLIEKLIADLDRAPLRRAPVTLQVPTSSFLTENGWRPGAAKSAQSVLEPKVRNRTTVRINGTARASFLALADLAGIKVIFQDGVAEGNPAPFNLYGVDVFEALDLLAWQTGNFWQVVDKETIRVIPDTPAARRDLEPIVEKTFRTVDPTEAGVKGMVNVVRTLIGLRDVTVDATNTIVIRDTADNLAVAEQLLAAIERP